MVTENREASAVARCIEAGYSSCPSTSSVDFQEAAIEVIVLQVEFPERVYTNHQNTGQALE